MKVPSARRLALMLGVLVLAGKGAQGLRNMLVSLLARRHAPAIAAAASAAPQWRLFSAFLRDLQDQKVAKVLLAADHVLVHAKEGGDAYKYVRVSAPYIHSWQREKVALCVCN